MNEGRVESDVLIGVCVFIIDGDGDGDGEAGCHGVLLCEAVVIDVDVLFVVLSSCFLRPFDAPGMAMC